MLDRQGPAGRIAVLDIETEPNPAAISIAPRGGGTNRTSLHRLAGYSLLCATETDDLQWSDMELHTRSDMPEYDMLFDLDEALTAAQERGATLVSYNGLAHDLPTLRRRVIANWMFALPGLAALSDMPHVDIMRQETRGSRTAWPALADLCAGFGIPTDYLPVRAVENPPSIPHRKSQVDVVATFLVLAHNLSARREESRTVSRAWLALVEFLKRPDVRQPHLAQFVYHPGVERARSEARLGPQRL